MVRRSSVILFNGACGGGTLAALLVVTLMLTVSGGVAEDKQLNETSSSSSLVWTAAKEEYSDNLMLSAEPVNESSSVAAAVVGDHDELDGGFSSLEGMLQWAIGHSDPDALKQSAQDAQRLSAAELKKRQMEIKELLILVEPIDNANDLNKLGGLALVIRELNHPESEIRTLSAWVLGKASQNNAVVQKQVLELGALSILMKMASSNSPEEAIKALYAVSALIRNNLAGQDLFYSKAGDKLLLDMLRNSSSDLRLCKKAVSLVSDLAENALLAIKNLLQLETANAVIFKDFCELDAALARMRRQLRMLEDSDSDFAENLETLIREVQSTFHRKLGEEEMRVVQ
ncbi:Hsp70 nucleotide exchange factor fes1 [Linum grandiflorum]